MTMIMQSDFVDMLSAVTTNLNRYNIHWSIS